MTKNGPCRKISKRISLTLPLGVPSMAVNGSKNEAGPECRSALEAPVELLTIRRGMTVASA